MRNRPFEIRPIGGALGAELHGIDLSAELSDETIARSARRCWITW